MGQGVSMFLAKDISEQRAEELRRLAHFTAGPAFYLCAYLDPTFRMDLYPMRNPEVVELAGAILARALEKGGMA